MKFYQYRMLWDYHTHTTYSHGFLVGKHGKGTVEENIQAAIDRGLEEIAISEHGPGHLFYGIRREQIPEEKAVIQALREKYPEIKIHFSVEANLTNGGPTHLDVDPELAKEFDFLIGGYHYGVAKCHGAASRILHGGYIKRRIEAKVTDLYVAALHENNLKILTHPGDKCPIYIGEVAKACEETNTLMEISTWHRHMTVEEIQAAMQYNVNFVISSDAHSPDRVGSFLPGLERAEAAGLDFSRIVNIGLRDDVDME